MPTLCHVTTRPALDRASAWLSAEPFLHCCTEAQLAFVLDRWFPGQTGLLVVRFDEFDAEGRLDWAPSEIGMAPFPHLFGRVPTAKLHVTEV